jgi:hypothetical protein
MVPSSRRPAPDRSSRDAWYAGELRLNLSSSPLSSLYLDPYPHALIIQRVIFLQPTE